MTPLTNQPIHRKGGVPRGLSATGPVLFSFGFRPFFLGGAIWACAAMIMWVLAISDHVDVGGEYRTIIVKMLETPEGKMAFEPAVIEVKAGETLRLSLMNAGELEHEFFLATPTATAEHAAMMQEMPDMQHYEPNAARLPPGASGEIVWKFGQSDDIVFACLIPGHFEAGMHGRVLLHRVPPSIAQP